ncbi:hypothetical protein CHH28_19405 [Bacterioplanes sanyensis]|uniref:Uncharacterized protein n=1 Tax=Bacterioplanes sanyensis TaxID=1249553 RepID=A0A222FPR2_9GAMM|nr:hypothetical protein CHH28_19405 [Bacterioplanes sanyensis]
MPTIHASKFWHSNAKSLICQAFKLPPYGNTGNPTGKACQVSAFLWNILVVYQYAFTFDSWLFFKALLALASRLFAISRPPEWAMAVPAGAARTAAPAKGLQGRRLFVMRRPQHQQRKKNDLLSARQAESYLRCFCSVEKHQKMLTYCK